MKESLDLVNQIEEDKNYDEYNENNKLVNNIGYSYQLKNSLKNNSESSNNNSDNNDTLSPNRNNQTISNQNRRYNSQLTNLESTINQNNNNLQDINNNLNYGRMSSTLDIRLGGRERKKMLLDNIKTQITLKQKTKLEELKKRKEEDAQYLKDMVLRYPFGRAGGGAPIRDKSGNLLTFRRNLISDLKYNQSPINVDDDYDEVWGKEKVNRKYNVNESQNINSINIENNINDENTIRPFSTNPQIKNNNLNLDNYTNNQYDNNVNNLSSLKQTYNYSTNNLFNSINNNSNLNNSAKILDYNNLYYKKILERKKKELELEKELENMETQPPQLNYSNNNQNERIYNLRNTNKRNVIYNVINENQNENEREKEYINKKDYYDNYNFVPKGQIHPRLENSFLFTDEINKLKNEIRVDQNALLDEITQIKKDAKNATKERKKVINDLEYLKSEINKINHLKRIEEEEKEKEKDNNYIHKFVKDNEYDEYIDNLIKRKQNDNYYYIDNSSFKNYENELPNESYITNQKNILNIKKTYMDENQMELEELIKKSNDILENLRDNENIEKEHKRKPEDYFNTSDYYFHTYRLNHANDYKEYGDDFNKDYYLNKYMKYNKKNNNDDYEVKIEKI